MKVALHSILRPGQETAYEQAHARIPAEMMQALQAAGITDWSIWRSGRDLFHVVESDDFDAAMTTLADDPVNDRWQEVMAAFVERFITDDDGSWGRSHVWTLTEQLRDEADSPSED
jgi:L-rhamnose mutarotase